MNAQQLRNSILQEAIEGRLVPQDPNDEPASVLLERIREEKKRLVKEGKLKKKDLDETPISEDEKPFEIPDSWVWVRLVNIGVAETGTTPSKFHPEYFGSFIPFLGPANMLNGQIISETQGLSEIGANYGRIVPKGSILQVCIGGSIGKCAIVDKPVTINQQINSITPLVCAIEFIFYVLQSDYFRLAIKDKATGTATPIINRGNWEQIAVPLPPLAEQKRIVAKIEELLPKVEEYGKAQEALDKLNEELPERLKKSVLQEAISGKLVPPNPNDEPASVLLNRIREEKKRLVKEGKLKKKDLDETPISENEKPFEIPESWEWVKFGDLVLTSTGKTPTRGDSKYWNKNTYPWVSISDMRQGEYVNSTKEFISQIAADEYFHGEISKKGTLIMSFKLTVGRTSILGVDAYHNEAIISIKTLADKNNNTRDYLSYILPVIANWGDSKDAIKGKTLNSKSIYNLLIPLPPLAEQKRIVAKIEEVFKAIDALS